MSENDTTLYKQINNVQMQPLVVNAPDEMEMNNSFQSVTKGRYEVLEKGQKLMNHDYMVDGKKVTGQKKASKDMEVIFGELDALNMVMSGLSFDAGDPDSLQAEGGALLDRMKKLMEKCDAYVTKKNPWTAEGTARYRLVDQIGERLSHDIFDFETKLSEFLGMPEEEKARIKDWTDFLNFERTSSYVHGQDNVTISHAEGNTSDVVVIEKDGKKLFFKEEDTLHDCDFTAITRRVGNKIWEEIKPGDEIKSGSKEYYKQALIYAFDANYCGMQDMKTLVIYGFIRCATEKGRFEDLKNFCTLVHATPHTGILKVIEGIEGIKDETKKQEIKKAVGDVFIDLKKSILTSHLGTNAAKISPGSGMAKRNVATSRMANLLNLGKLVPKSEMTKITVGEKKIYGVTMDEMEGVENISLYQKPFIDAHEGEQVKYSPEAMKDLMDLKIFDIICGQTDRHVANRMVTLEQVEKDGVKTNVIKSVGGIDGDLSFGEIKYAEFKDKTYSKKFSIESETGLSIAGMSLELAHAILALSPQVVDYEMMGILSKPERKALIDRIQGVQAAIQKQMDYEEKNKSVPSKFIAKDKWGEFQDKLAEKVKEDKSLEKELSTKSYLDPIFIKGITISKK